ncbi:ribosomal-protein-alanine N-acetyltransferase [Haemophilus influenzae]|nr:alanine acetyltransferase [Haemophilus influenzae]PRM81160.1 ribosomal-protein-alanine N-acetyltransferase [Haemophilus influenzae]PRM81189.1 ribosomal-protein-alanine N-acetyltransferase [Haemophilus influenzae]CWX34508.1 ribosomal-protein-alanine N-acetyltransferase [Haemophilus influenzae]CWX72289.1 ribosomal-protein-alanine N-acetyltransferase [Haemophilus influenzae]
MATNSAVLIMSIISQIEACDFERLYEIEQQAHLVPWSLGTLKNNQGERYLNLKLIENNQIIGFAICQTVLDEANLFNIAILPNYQGCGFGKLLLGELIFQLKERGVQTLWLEVRESNPARFLYEKVGFNEVDIRKNYYPKPSGGRENAVVMACYL